MSESRVEFVAFGCKFSDVADLSGASYVVASLVFFCLSLAVGFVAHCCSVCRFLPSRMGCNSMDRVSMGG